jgi:S-adenosylmethionine synthetase
MRLFSTEQVSKYHPDKYADQISDAILTACLKQDHNAHVGCETLVKDKTVVIAGEISTTAKVDYEAVVRRVAAKLGYEVDKFINLLSEQSPEINKAVEQDERIGAGDQGIMFGYATSLTESHLPLAFEYANKVIKAIEDDVQNGILKGDAKCQVTIDLDTNKIKSTLISVCHIESLNLHQIRYYVKQLLIRSGLYDRCESFLINPSGTWNVGGPIADAGVTGRKIVCDQYGGFCAVGGGAFSGKDPTKVDRSASYMARRIAVDLVRNFELKECEVQLGYAIGVAEPVSVSVIADNKVDFIKYISEKYDLTPKGIIKYLNLYEIDYEKLAEGCHYR